MTYIAASVDLMLFVLFHALEVYSISFLCELIVFIVSFVRIHNKQAVREAATICPAPCDLDLLTLKVVSESCVTWAIYVPILIFPGSSVLDLGLMYATDVRRASSLNAPAMEAGA